MENYSENNKKIETDYNAHQENPGPSEESITEKDDKNVGITLKWVIGIVILALIIVWFVL